ncbi:MAG: coiled coil domain-containing protein [Candidatus Loosdrechtia sp.]|uniref:coiled coil domain-containing protein n=1 Tax=Candidatus Loosdrechtia sp. TaxID=3101272 RepID=UPI003A6B779B|nr:MAG: hypothetical protein QY305_04720 [Candidatus Jettenia sp. AMX2]
MDRKVFIDTLITQLRKLDAEIDKFEARLQKAESDAKAACREQIQELRSKKAVVQDRLDEIMQASEEAWGELKSGAEEAFDDMKKAFQSALSKFK